LLAVLSGLDAQLAGSNPQVPAHPTATLERTGVEQSVTATHHGEVTQPQPERDVDDTDDIEAWRDLQDVLEERDREYWAGGYTEDE